MDFFSNPYLYIEYIIVVVLTTEIIKKQTKRSNWHPQWLTLAVGAVWAGIGIGMNFFVLSEAPSFWKLFISYLSANFAYTYFLKPIKKLLNIEEEPTPVEE